MSYKYIFCCQANSICIYYYYKTMNTCLNTNLLYENCNRRRNNLKRDYRNHEKCTAEYIGKKYYTAELPPVWPDKIAAAEKFVIRLKNMTKYCLSILDKKNKIIYLTNDKNILDKWGNFAIAQVLGKLFLGHESSLFDPTTITHTTENKEDFEANKFASYLLMPDNFLRDYAWLEEDFATVFRVPQEVVDFRMNLI